MGTLKLEKDTKQPKTRKIGVSFCAAIVFGFVCCSSSTTVRFNFTQQITHDAGRRRSFFRGPAGCCALVLALCSCGTAAGTQTAQGRGQLGDSHRRQATHRCRRNARELLLLLRRRAAERFQIPWHSPPSLLLNFFITTYKLAESISPALQ